MRACGHGGRDVRGQRGLHRVLERVTHTCNFLGREGAGVPCVRPPVARPGPSHQVKEKNLFSTRPENNTKALHSPDSQEEISDNS